MDIPGRGVHLRMVWRSISATLLISISLSAQSSLSSAEYEKRISEYQNRNKVLREQIAQEQATILDLKNKIEATKKRIAAIRKNRLDALGITAEDVAAASEAIAALKNDISSLQRVSDELFQQDSSRVFSFRTRLQSLRSRPASRLRDLSDQLGIVSDLVNQCEQRFAQLSLSTAAEKESPAPLPQENQPVESYTVLELDDKPESLFSIAGKVYGDPMQWPRIYQANKELIDRNFSRYKNNSKPSVYSDPSDLIFPGQVLTIPR